LREKTFHLEIVTPKGLKFEGEATWLRLPGVMGETGILADHAPLLALLEPGVGVYRASGSDHPLALGEGFVTVAKNRVMVLVESADRPEEIDKEAARQEVARLDATPGGPWVHPESRARRRLAMARQQVASWT
jgi:F-type H+-transporting ATPase subunit epsilon